MSRWKKFNDDDVPDDFVLPPGDVVRGRLLFKKHCAQCHVIEKDQAVKTGCTLLGPNLYGVYGRTAGSGPRTSLIDSSQAIKDSGIVWTDITLMRYLKNPRQFTQHPLSMNFRGLDNWQDRVDLIWYMKAACEDATEGLKEGLSSMRSRPQQQQKPQQQQQQPQQQQQQQQLHPAGGTGASTGGPPERTAEA
ncbi:cytochrome c, putative [Eimeria acervulina]|uniref:Cytochrome c, putative n=1 Tax=Eimeria acervulina TaxID=5801 RepID=U6GM55_EIMAC|nr:cytochrome c, putative [Eimeria acervulina]CDI80637.1 cytochrome c, putative [Eimeria acervulina]